jgi:hypothetical protein
MRLWPSLLIAAMCAMPFSGEAQQLGAYGIGIHSCAEFAKLYAANPKVTENVYYAWAEGFISGLNMSAIANNLSYRTPEPGGDNMRYYMLYIRSYCDSHPLSPYYGAVTTLYTTVLSSGR